MEKFKAALKFFSSSELPSLGTPALEGFSSPCNCTGEPSEGILAQLTV